MRKNIKLVTLSIRYVLPIIEIILVFPIHDFLVYLGKNNIVDPTSCYQLFRFIMCFIFILSLILSFKYFNKKTIFIQFIIFLIYGYCILLDNVSSYRIAY